MIDFFDMKIGILSMQRVPNYGSWMQAYALRQLLLQNGADEVRFVDIEQGRCLLAVKKNFAVHVCTFLKEVWQVGIKNKMAIRHYGKMMNPMFAKFYQQLDVQGPVKASDCDAVVIGSDEVFNAVQSSTFGYTPQLYGRMNCSYVFSYAGSFGHTTLSQLKEYQIAEEIGATMKTLKGLSVRDINSQEIVKELTGIKAEMHLDPVLIYGYKEEVAKVEKIEGQDYLLVYTYGGRIRNSEEVAKIKAFAQCHDLRIMSLFCSYSWCDGYFITQSPMEVLKYFKNAAYVMTDTFHGTIFSIITERKFCTLLRSSNKQKLTSLLSMLHLSNRVVTDSIIMSRTLVDDIDYHKVNLVLSGYRQLSNSYLEKNIKAISLSSK